MGGSRPELTKRLVVWHIKPCTFPDEAGAVFPWSSHSTQKFSALRPRAHLSVEDACDAQSECGAGAGKRRSVQSPVWSGPCRCTGDAGAAHHVVIHARDDIIAFLVVICSWMQWRLSHLSQRFCNNPGINLCNNSGENLWNDPGAAGAGDTGDDIPVEMQDRKHFRQNESRLRQAAPNRARVQGGAPQLWISQKASKVHWSQACAGQGAGNGIECCTKCLKHVF